VIKLSSKYQYRKKRDDDCVEEPKEKTPCCQKMGRLLNFFAISVWVAYYFEIMMLKKANMSTENVSLQNHIILFIVLIIPGLYLTKIRNKKK